MFTRNLITCFYFFIFLVQLVYISLLLMDNIEHFSNKAYQIVKSVGVCVEHSFGSLWYQQCSWIYIKPLCDSWQHTLFAEFHFMYCSSSFCESWAHFVLLITTYSMDCVWINLKTSASLLFCCNAAHVK